MATWPLFEFFDNRRDALNRRCQSKSGVVFKHRIKLSLL
jgi:hypothetical protein